MDMLTFTLLAAVIAILAIRAGELAVLRPDAFAKLLSGARAFAEDALAESAALRASQATVTPIAGPERATQQAPALAA